MNPSYVCLIMIMMFVYFNVDHHYFQFIFVNYIINGYMLWYPIHIFFFFFIFHYSVCGFICSLIFFYNYGDMISETWANGKNERSQVWKINLFSYFVDAHIRHSNIVDFIISILHFFFLQFNFFLFFVASFLYPFVLLLQFVHCCSYLRL